MLLSIQGFQQPPPVYTQRTIRMNQMTTNNTTNTTTNTNNAANSPQTNPALRLQYQQMQREALLQQQQQKERLLQQQQKQSLVVPVNATANADQLCK